MSLPVDKALRKAQNHIKAGELAEAEELYKQVLFKFPKNKKAIQGYQKLKAGVPSKGASSLRLPDEQFQELDNLFNQWKFEELLAKIKPLIDLFSKDIDLYNIQGAANAALGKYDAAIESYEQAIKIRPDYAGAYYNMGISLQAQGNLGEAIDNYKQAIKIKPDYADAFYNMGNASKDKGELDAAIDSYNHAIKIRPDYADAYYNMGICLQAQGNLGEAIDSYKQAIKIKPDYAEAYYNMGIASKDKGELDATIDSYKQAIKIKPDYAEAYSNMGNALRDKGELDAAIDSYKQALAINPDYANAYINMGASLNDQGELDAAIDSYNKAIKIKPDYAEAYYNMGNALKGKGDSDAAINSYRQAIKIKPDYADAFYNMGNALKEKGELDATIDSYKQAIKIKPDYTEALSQKLHQQAMICDWTEIEEDREIIINLGTSEQDINPFDLMTFEDVPNRHRLRSEIHAKIKFKQKPVPLPTIQTQKPKRLRLGYFSSDFRQHSVAHGIVNIFASHNRERFEIYGYSFGPDDGSKVRQKIIESVDVFDDVKEMKEKDIALLARQDEIDIAIDLNGYTAKSRPGIFAYRAAPIQIHFLGSANSMGTDSIDYYIGEDLGIPKEYDHGYSESIIRLPHWVQAKYNTEAVSDLPMTRADMGLPEQGFVFCCFNNSYKISSAEFDIWMRLLNKVSGSVLWILKSNKWMEQNLRQEAQKRGIPAERLVFAERVPHPVHLARQRLADLLLDTFNVNAGVTAGDALWVGLPMVTKLGKGFAARMGGCLLKAIGMPELITETEHEYEALILDLATNPERLASIKRKLADNRLSKPLFNTELFTKHLEDGYQQAYQRHFDGKNPANIYVNEQPKPAP